MKRALAVLAGIVAVGIMLPALAATKNVSLKNISYNPSTVTVKVGDKVVWTNDEDVPHSVTAADNSFGSTQNSNRGPLIGIAVAAVLLAAGGGLLLWFRTRGISP